MHPYSFIISLRAKHPKDDLLFLTDLLGKQPRTNWVAGEPRRTPKGTELGGTRSNSYWVARLTEEETNSETWQLEDFIEKCLAELSPHSEALEKFVTSGGALELYVSLYGARNFGFVMPPSLLSRLGGAHIELQFDVYPGPW